MAVDTLEITMPEVDWGMDELEDMNERIATLEKEGKRCVPVRFKGSIAWLVVGYDDTEKCFRNSELAWNFNRSYVNVAGFTMFNTTGEEHKEYKTTMLSLLSPRRFRLKQESLLRPIADQLIDEFGDDREIDFDKAFAIRYPWMLMSNLLGMTVPRESEMRLRQIIMDLAQLNEVNTWAELRRKALVAKASFDEIYRPVVEERRRNRGDDLLSEVFDLLIYGRKLNDDEVLATLGMFYDGAIAPSFQLPNLLHAILCEPKIKHLMLTNPDKREAAIDELLRLNPAVGIVHRLTVEPTEIGGIIVPANSMIVLCLPGANRSTARFNNPNEFSLERSAPALTFGAGIRMCPGIHLMRAEAIVAINRLIDRLPGLRLAGKPSPTVGALGRSLKNGLRIAFDEILPPDRVPMHL